MKKILFLLGVCVVPSLAYAQESSTEETYYQRVPRLVKQADGTYRVSDDYYFVPVKPNERANPVAIDVENEKKETNQHSDTETKSSRADLPGGRAYFSVGVSYAKSKSHAKVEFAGVSEDGMLFQDWQPAFKVAYGSQFTQSFRMEILYQYRNKIQESDYEYGIAETIGAKMQDIGVNLFLTITPKAQAKLFIGAGIAATRVDPIWSINGINLNGVLWKSSYFATPSAFIGVEWPDEKNQVAMDITFFYSKTLINRGFTLNGVDFKIKDITSYGANLNFRFNL